MKKTGFIVLTLVLVASLTACRRGNVDENTNPSDNSTPPATTTEPAPTTEPTTLPTIIDPTFESNIPDPDTNNGTDGMDNGMDNGMTDSNADNARKRFR